MNQDVSNLVPDEIRRTKVSNAIMSHLSDAQHLMSLGSAWSIHEAAKRVDFAKFLVMNYKDTEKEVEIDTVYSDFVDRFPAKQYLPLNAFAEEDGREEALPEEVYWTAPVGGWDDFDSPITDEIIDGKTKGGPWAIMTPASWKKHGAYKELGLGKGQKYKRQNDGKWKKVEG